MLSTSDESSTNEETEKIDLTIDFIDEGKQEEKTDKLASAIAELQKQMPPNDDSSDDELIDFTQFPFWILCDNYHYYFKIKK